MKVNTLTGAAISGAITFLVGATALLQTQEVAVVTDISQAEWLVLTFGSLISFLKDAQAVRVRRMVNRVTHSNDGGGTVT